MQKDRCLCNFKNEGVIALFLTRHVDAEPVNALRPVHFVTAAEKFDMGNLEGMGASFLA